MLQAELNLHPYGDERQKRNLTTIVIGNDGTGSNGFGNYDVTITEDGREYKFRIENWRRTRSALDLLSTAIDKHIELRLENEDESRPRHDKQRR